MHVSVEFADDLESETVVSLGADDELSSEDDDATTGELYIGKIRLDKRTPTQSSDVEIDCQVSVTLPKEMFERLVSMDQRWIRFQAIHKIIKEQTSAQKEDKIVAFVKRCYFWVGEEIDRNANYRKLPTLRR